MRTTPRHNRRPRPAAPAATANRAFTLLELLVALAMAAIIAGSMYAGLRIAFRARASSEAAVEPVRTAELATSLLRADFESALPADAVPAAGEVDTTLAGPFVGTDAQGNGGLPADSVTFYTAGNPTDPLGAAAAGATAGGAAGAFSMQPSLPQAGEVRGVEIGLVARPAPGNTAEQVLVRRITTNLLSPQQVEPYEEVLCRGVRALNIRYFDGLAWQDSWDSTLLEDEIPSAVEVTLELERESAAGVRVMRFPRVFLLSCSSITPGTPVMGTATGTGTGGAAP